MSFSKSLISVVLVDVSPILVSAFDGRVENNVSGDMRVVGKSSFSFGSDDCKREQPSHGLVLHLNLLTFSQSGIGSKVALTRGNTRLDVFHGQLSRQVVEGDNTSAPMPSTR